MYGCADNVLRDSVFIRNLSLSPMRALPLDPVVLHLPSLPCLKSIIVENGSQYLSDALNRIEIVNLIQRHRQVAFLHTVMYFPVIVIYMKVELFVEILNALNTKFVI